MTQLYVTLRVLAHGLGERLHNEDEGAAAIEYGLIAGLIALALIAGATVLGTEISDLFDRIGGTLEAL